jgi:hypothetical protein
MPSQAFVVLPNCRYEDALLRFARLMPAKRQRTHYLDPIRQRCSAHHIALKFLRCNAARTGNPVFGQVNDTARGNWLGECKFKAT